MQLNPADALALHLPGLWTVATFGHANGWRFVFQTADAIVARQRYYGLTAANDGAGVLIDPDGQIELAWVSWGQKVRSRRVAT